MDFQTLKDLTVGVQSLKGNLHDPVEAVLDTADTLYERTYGRPPPSLYKDMIRQVSCFSQTSVEAHTQKSMSSTQPPISQVPTVPVSTSGDNTGLLYLDLVNIEGLVSNILEKVKSLETILAPPILQELNKRINGNAIPIMQLLNEHAKDLQKVIQTSGQLDPLSRYNGATPMEKARQMMKDPNRTVNSSQSVFPTPPTISYTDGMQPQTQEHHYVNPVHRNLSRNQRSKRGRRNVLLSTQRERRNSFLPLQNKTEDTVATLIAALNAAHQSLLKEASKQSSQTEGYNESRRPPTSAATNRNSSLMSSHYFDGFTSVKEAIQKERELNEQTEELKLQHKAEDKTEAKTNSKVRKSPNDSDTPKVSIGFDNPMFISPISPDSEFKAPAWNVSCVYKDDNQGEKVIYEDVSLDEQTQNATSKQASNPDTDTSNI